MKKVKNRIIVIFLIGIWVGALHHYIVSQDDRNHKIMDDKKKHLFLKTRYEYEEDVIKKGKEAVEIISTDFRTANYYMAESLIYHLLMANKYGKYDLAFENGDLVNVTGKNSLYNAIVIAIMTRFQELFNIPLYADFGCRVHELLKDNKSDMVKYDVELFINEVLEKMRRISEINEITVTDSEKNTYNVYFNVTSINDEMVSGSVDI